MGLAHEVERCVDVVEAAGEKLANALTHGFGLLLSVMGFSVLLVTALAYTDYAGMASMLIYGTCLCALFLASTLYHSTSAPSAQRSFQIFDHCAIYWLIAGTYTPILLLGIKGELGNTLLLIIWSLALIGSFLKIFFWERFHKLSLFLYIGMGWLALLIAYPLLQSPSFSGLSFLLLSLGGVIFTLGTWFFSRDHLPYYHAIWHVFVLGGSACHFGAIYYCLAPYPYA